MMGVFTVILAVLVALSFRGSSGSSVHETNVDLEADDPRQKDVVNFDDTPGLGRTFDGIGAISGGGATSKLLVNYPQKQRDEILDFLFKPNFGASLQIFKVEIGGDTQSTEGTEASHMHNSWEENYQRGYEWWMMTEAKKRNRNIKLAALPWGFPGWLADNDAGKRPTPYEHPEKTANYVLRWITAARNIYNLTIDYVGIWNERDYNCTYIKTLRKVLDAAGFEETMIIAADELQSWNIAKDILADKELEKAVYAIGSHYPGSYSTETALNTGKRLWASEDFDTINNSTGAGCLARELNRNYVNGHMTSTTAWNLVASYYSHLPYLKTGLMTAMEPWSGHYTVADPIWVTAHTTQFVPVGWKYLMHGQGVGQLPKGGTFVAATNKAKDQLTIVIETMSHDHSECIRPKLPPFTVTPQTITLQLKGSFANISKLNVWHSKLHFDETASQMFEKKSELFFKAGKASITLGLDEIYTLTTLATGNKGFYPRPPPSQHFPYTYNDDFEGYREFQEPFYLTPQVGSYEVRAENGNKFARQTVLQRPIYWCDSETINKTISVIGDYLWSDMTIEVDYRLPDVNATQAVFLAARVSVGGCDSNQAQGIYVFVFDEVFLITNDFARKKIIYKEQTPRLKPTWNRLSLSVSEEKGTVVFNNNEVFNFGIPREPKNGWLALGTDSFGLADFDNLAIHKI